MRGTREADEQFAAFYLAEQPRLAGYCRGLLGGDEATAWDIAQEALVRTWSRWPKVDQPRAYCYLVAVNLVRRSWREQARHRQRRHELATREAQEGMPDAERYAVRDLVERLPKRLRMPTLLHYWADVPSVEIARMMNIQEGTVRRRLLEARTLLAAGLAAATDLPASTAESTNGSTEGAAHV